MLRGLYTSASGMNAELLRQDVVANNIANAGTTGFKKDDAVFETFPNRLLKRIHDRLDASGADAPAAAAFLAHPQTVGVLGQGVMTAGTPTHFSDGSLRATERPLDLALQGNGLFTVQRADGSVAFTRNGSFTLNGDHQLTTSAGDLVMGASGSPVVINGGDVVVDQTGVIKVDGVESDRLALAAYDPQAYQKLGESLYVKSADALEGIGDEPAMQGRVMQGYTEQSNVQVVSEMVRMIEVNRAYESNAKTIQMQDETLSRLINDVGKPSA